MSISMKTIDKVLDLRTKNPSMMAADIAKELNISRELVRQLLIKLNLPTRVDRCVPRSPLRYEVNISPNNIGAICELQACSDLLMRGFSVFRSVTPNSKCDLVAIHNSKCYRVEVRAAKKFKCVVHGDYDVLAAVNPDGSIQYTPNIDNLTKTT